MSHRLRGDAGHGYDATTRKVVTKLLVDSDNPSQQSFLMELADNPTGLKAILPA